MNRRQFLGAVAAGSAIRPARAAVEAHFPRRSPYEALFQYLEPGRDEFFFEKEAVEIGAALDRLLTDRALPLAPEFSGVSPAPVRYASIAQGVTRAEYDLTDTNFAQGLAKWLDSLGTVQAARYFVLAADRVRYEIASPGRYRVGLWEQKWKAGRLTSFLPIEETVASSPAPLFRDVTAHAFGGVDSFERQLRMGAPYWRARLDSASGIDLHAANGIAVGDIDGDGWDEIYVCQSGGLPNRFYRNRGDGVLEDIAERSGLAILDATSSALFADFRNAGCQDAVVLRPAGPLYFLNDGHGRFTHKPDSFHFASTPSGSFMSMAAADYDRDGKLDLYLCSYSISQSEHQYGYPTPYFDAQNGPPNFLFRNRLSAGGEGWFEDVTQASGMDHNNRRFSFAAAWCDYDGDGWPDLYVANDFGRNNLYRNEEGRFRDVAAEAGVEDIGAGMSASWFDYDGDGRPDLYVSNMWSAPGQRVAAQSGLHDAESFRRHAKGNTLFRNRGDGRFEDSGASEGVEMGRWAWSSDGIDFDNDGTPEIFIAAGMLTNPGGADLESFFWRKVAVASPAAEKSETAYENGWNALDAAVHGKYGLAGNQANVFYVRRGGRYHDFSGVSGLDCADDTRAFAAVDLDGDGNLDLVLKSRLGPQVRVFQNNSGAGRRSVAFRLRGTRSNRDAIGARVEVDGKVRFLAAGSGFLSQHTKDLYFGLNDSAAARLVRIDWPSGLRQEFRDLQAGHWHTIQEGSVEVSSVPFRARREFPEGAAAGENRSEFADTWLLDPAPLPERFAGPGHLELAEPLTGERAAWYTLFRRYLFDLRAAELKLPIWLLVDEESRAHKIYFSPPAAGDLQRMTDRDRTRLALPFAGVYYTMPHRNPGVMGAALFDSGFPEQALPYLKRAPQDRDVILFAIGQIHLGAGRTSMARDYYEQGLALNPKAAEGWNGLGGVERRQGNPRAALQYYLKALSLRPDMVPAMFNAAQSYTALGDTAAGEKLFRRILEINPNDADAANQLGELYVAAKRDRDAGRWFEQAIAARRDYADAINNLGGVYMRQGQAQDAIAAFRYGIEVAPDNELLYLNLAGVYWSLGSSGRAREILERLLALKPESAGAKRALRELEKSQ